MSSNQINAPPAGHSCENCQIVFGDDFSRCCASFAKYFRSHPCSFSPFIRALRATEVTFWDQFLSLLTIALALQLTSMTTPAFSTAVFFTERTTFNPSFQRIHHARRQVRPCLSPKRRAQVIAMDGSGGLDEMTCRDAFREWIVARDQGEVANDAPDEHLSCAASSVDVLFVGKDNSTVSVAAEAIFTDLCEKHALHCFSSHSAGTCVGIEGELPDRTFIDALRSKRGLDISRKMACTVDKTDLESYSLVVCMDEATRSELLYMVADEEGRYNDAEEKRFVVLSSYCTDPKLQAMQFKSGRYARDTMNMLLSALVDSCDGLLMWLMENPPMLQT